MNDKVYEYNVIIAESDNLEGFTELVDVALNNGWQCQGGIAVSFDQNNKQEWCYQAMIREIKNER